MRARNANPDAAAVVIGGPREARLARLRWRPAAVQALVGTILEHDEWVGVIETTDPHLVVQPIRLQLVSGLPP